MMGLTMTYITLRLILFVILTVGLIGWIFWCGRYKAHWLLAILPISVIVHAMIFVSAGTLSRLGIINLSDIITTWSQILRIQEYIVLGLAPIIMLLVRKYE